MQPCPLIHFAGLLITSESKIHIGSKLVTIGGLRIILHLPTALWGEFKEELVVSFQPDKVDKLKTPAAS